MPRPSWDDLKNALMTVPPGDYATRELLPAYLAWAEKEGKPAVDAKQLGEALAQETCVETAGLRHGAKIWYVTPEGLNCRNWFQIKAES